jgi:hypothetical protein
MFFMILSYESYRLNTVPEKGIIFKLQKIGIVNSNKNISPEPGKPISLFYGWVGVAVMLLTNPYILRKKWSLLSKYGTLKGWLDFHIFCGLLGPTFILFHSNFKVRGLVAISFWSMVVSVTSGIIGRYFYVQIASKKSEFTEKYERSILSLKKRISEHGLQLSDTDIESYLKKALVFVGANTQSINPFVIYFTSTVGDARLLFGSPEYPKQAGPRAARAIRDYAINYRRAQFLESFKKLMSYWHTFHMPFAFFMYVAAIFHIAAALILGVA